MSELRTLKDFASIHISKFGFLNIGRVPVMFKYDCHEQLYKAYKRNGLPPRNLGTEWMCTNMYMRGLMSNKVWNDYLFLYSTYIH